ncbi:MAG: hypothetical protein RIA69_09680 [Cyclobacteriaceae bacterium]|uniref:type IV toxin-antitoxin system AbiEi family antitoxin domain-containing protein n=1 Tax=Fulvivirga sp. TaxID=1931237 RepID=UPI0032EE0348
MADSVYISSNLTSTQLEFMKLLDEFEIDIFRFEEIEQKVNRNFSNLNEVLENLVHKKLISRIERGKFCKVNFRDEFVIGTFVTKNGVVAYWSALNLHGLTEQFPNTVFIQTTHKKNDKVIFGIDYKFVKISESKRTGIIKEGYGSHSYAMTDVEKTIVDCFDLPHYSGGYAELIRAFANAKLSGERMINYCNAVNNIAATKRIGYLAEILDKKGMKSFIRFAKDQVTQTYNPIDPLGADTGKFNAEWRLRLNITETEILDITNKQY